jgi:hypothetical protein
MVSLLSGLTVGIPIATLLTYDTVPDIRLFRFFAILQLPLLGSILIGLPFAMLVFVAFERAHTGGIVRALLCANAVGFLLALCCLGLAGSFGVIFFGLPIVVTANLFAVFGWLIMLRPLQRMEFKQNG